MEKLKKSNNIKPRNEKGEPHGYWEVYFINNLLANKGVYINGSYHGPWEFYWENGILSAKGNFKYGKEIGYWVYKSCDNIFFVKTYYIL